MFDKYLSSHHEEDILRLMTYSDVDKHYSVNISFVELFENDTNLGNSILKDPEKTLLECDKSIIHVQCNLLERMAEDSAYFEKPHVHTRIYELPECPELHRTVLPQSQDLGMFLQIIGTVTRVTAIKLLEFERQYTCAKCKHILIVKADFEHKYVIIPPKKCSNADGCRSATFVTNSILNTNNCRDYQEIKIQEHVSKSGVSAIPNSMWVVLEADLVDLCQPGDDVTICGIIKRRWRSPPSANKRLDIELVMKANNLQANNSQTSTNLITPEVKEQFVTFWENHKGCPLSGRDLILKSFCPKIYGLYYVKLAICVTLAGGSSVKGESGKGAHIRSEPHLLLVGDPGTGKSELLQFATKVIPRSVFTTGIGTTKAGLTVNAVMEDGEWQLEGGALVLSDGGICCIDEFNSMKEHDRTSIHEAMEQQTISVAKASIVSKLSTRCSVLAAMNPKSGLDSLHPRESLNIGLASPLISRFDLILFLQDSKDGHWDELVADHVLQCNTTSIKAVENVWSPEMLQVYFSLIKKINPTLTPESNKILSVYYQVRRRAESRNKARTTVRLLDSLIRLSQAHARLMYRSEVQVVDAITAIHLSELSLQDKSTIFTNDENVTCPLFPTNSEQACEKISKDILEKLELFDMLKHQIRFINNTFGRSAGKTEEDRAVKTYFSENTFEVQEKNKNVANDGRCAMKIQNRDDSESELEEIINSETENVNIIDFKAINCIPSVNDSFDFDFDASFQGTNSDDFVRLNKFSSLGSTSAI